MDGIPGLAVGSLDGDRVVCGGGWVGARVLTKKYTKKGDNLHIFKTYMLSRQSLLTDLSFATKKISNNMSMRVLGPNLEDFGPKLD